MKKSLPPLPDISLDFYVLSSSQVVDILAHADAAKYRKPKNANGSRGRYFWAKLQREHARKIKQLEN